MKQPARLFLIAVGMASMASAMPAQQPAQCVNPQLVDGLVFLGRGDQKVSVTRDLPSSMGGFRAPAGFSLIGTGLQQEATKVAYKTSFPGTKAYSMLLAALGTEGWLVEAPAMAAATFNVAGGMKNGTLCRNGERRNLLVVEYAGTTYASIASYAQASRRDCNAPDPALAMPIGGTLNLMPRFQFPAGTTIAQGGGGGGSTGTYTTSSRVISDETQAALVDHLAGQMVAQGWQRDTGWAGSRSAGSVWRRSEDSGPMSGTLEIVRVSDRTYDVDFTTVQPR